MYYSRRWPLAVYDTRSTKTRGLRMPEAVIEAETCLGNSEIYSLNVDNTMIYRTVFSLGLMRSKESLSRYFY